MGPKSAIRAIEKHGILLVYPIQNKTEPSSLWSVAYPRSKMRWEWDDDGDDRVARLWHLREELSTSRKVIYAKWFQGRATFFSRPVFRALLRIFRDARAPLSRDARLILEVLEESSPQSTRQIKLGASLQGRLLESTYNRAMKELWTRLSIVAFGEVDEGSFPSLAVGATKLIFEDLYLEAEDLTYAQALSTILPAINASESMRRYFKKAVETASAPGVEF